MEAKVKPSDLRIGNWMQNHSGEPYQVTASTINGVNTITGKWNIQIKPIPLDEGWAERLGLAPISKGLYMRMNVYIHFNHDAIWFQKGFEKLCKLKYVHELQNLYYALEKEELQTKEPNKVNSYTIQEIPKGEKIEYKLK